MTIEIYLDAINGSDTLGNGSSLAPYKTLQYFCDSVAVKNNADYKVFLNNGVYEITNGTIFGQFNSGNIAIIGKGENTEIIQKAYMYQNSVGGNLNFTLTIAKCKYNILTTLIGANVNGFRWTWNFYNVLFEYTPNNQTSVFSVNSKELVFRNCVKLTNTTSFLRKNSSIISVYDSMGYFTSGYQTTQADWDKGGNKIGSLDNYMELLDYQGEYPWVVSKSLILHEGEYKKWNPQQDATVDIYSENIIPIMTTNTNPSGLAFIDTQTSDNYRASYAFDRQVNTLAESNNRDGFIGYKFTTPKKINAYSIQIGSLAYSISNWRFQGSTDTTNGADGVWEDLHAVNYTFTASENKTFYFSNDKEYIAYRIKLAKAPTESLYSDFYEIGFYEKLSDGKPEVTPHWSTVSTTLSSSQFLEQGMDSLSPLLDRNVTTLEPMAMVDKSEILGDGEIGKLFSKTIDLKKYFDIRSIRTEVE